MTTIADVTKHLESIAPLAYQESYDNSGLLVGDPSIEVKGVLCTLDCTEEVVDEALSVGANLIIAHHPIIFSGLRRLTGADYVQRTVIKAIQNNISLYAIHTNLDNVLQNGVSSRMADRLGLTDQRILRPKKETLSKLETFVPMHAREDVLTALYKAGAGQIGNYSDCSFRTQGIGTYTPDQNANPHIGSPGTPESTKEEKIELVLPSHLESPVIKALRAAHPYEEVSYYLTKIENRNPYVGSGVIGILPEELKPKDFLKTVKEAFQTGCIRYTNLLNKPIKTVALCGGSGSDFLKDAITQKADAYISADFKYHQFFDADHKIVIADIGHYESEQFTVPLLGELIQNNFSTFALYFSKTITNPISYFTH